jgi:hypothetical protein
MMDDKQMSEKTAVNDEVDANAIEALLVSVTRPVFMEKKYDFRSNKTLILVSYFIVPIALCSLIGALARRWCIH